MKPIIITPEKAKLGRTAYLLIQELLNNDYISWKEAIEISSTRTANPVSEIRKAIEYDDIINIRVPTKYSFYDRYALNRDNPESILRMQMLFDYIASKPRVQQLLEKVNPDWLKN